jgi:hypothetical protein
MSKKSGCNDGGEEPAGSGPTHPAVNPWPWGGPDQIGVELLQVFLLSL